ncbi:hypothetical protein TNCV_354421 [Trichonephila clavipes]|uniref:Uncharacterized protein n=1 Tax=Trichonephila clavipes TaxID=2585209 RepID=A0A8X6W149_TRICX|nr:hypothetical protein TNCV_354421 [Trichonephila clavipes]
MKSTLNRLIPPNIKLALRYNVLLYKAVLAPIMLYRSPNWEGEASYSPEKISHFSQHSTVESSKRTLVCQERSLA